MNPSTMRTAMCVAIVLGSVVPFLGQWYLVNLVGTSLTLENKPVIVWMVQGPASDHLKWYQRFGNISHTILVYHSYNGDCLDCILDNNRTTWLTGNNLLIRHALEIPNVKYYVRSDNDLEMACKNNPHNDPLYCWRSFNDHLIDVDASDYPVISPKTWWDPSGEPDLYQSCPDMTLMAIRPDYLPSQFPMTTYLQDKGWNFVIHAYWEIVQRCIPNHILTVGDWTLSNPSHNSYPQQYGPMVEKYVTDILNTAYRPIGPFSVKKRLLHRCSVSSNSPIFHDNKCLDRLKERFDKWVEMGTPLTTDQLLL